MSKFELQMEKLELQIEKIRITEGIFECKPNGPMVNKIYFLQS